MRTLLLLALLLSTPIAIPAAQAPKKARVDTMAEASGPAHFQGRTVQARGRALPGMGKTLTAFYARANEGEELVRFVVSFQETPELPRTTVTRAGKELDPPAAMEVLGIEGLRVEVDYRPEIKADWQAYVAERVEVEGFEARLDVTGVPTSLMVEELLKGEGREARPGDTVTVHYTGWLLDGTKFDSSRDRARAFVFRLGDHQVIRGWDVGVAGMRVGGRRRLVVPPDMGYGRKGAGKGAIPPNATLVFDIELIKVQ
jgi:FKBP-type peptidyl-prolyl cis-trans isomerase FkpA